MEKKGKHYSKNEDQVILNYLSKVPYVRLIDYERVARILKRSTRSIQNRWYKYLKNRKG